VDAVALLNTRRQELDFAKAELAALMSAPTTQFTLADMPENREGVHELVRRWLQAQARSYLTQRVAELATEHGFSYARLFIRSQTTKWGTCSSKKNLSLNWKLIQCPPEVIDYLIIHELSHLREMNHSARFWSLVAHLYPEYKKAEGWLKR
jgi:predicted metal-dependent hydrolase